MPSADPVFSTQTELLHRDRLAASQSGAVHAGVQTSVPFTHPDAETLVKVFQGEAAGFTYARQSNPTNAALEAKISLLERARETAVFATGMGAISALFFALLKAGDHVLCSRNIFGNTASLLRRFQGFGVEVDFVDATQAGAVAAGVRANTRLVFAETIANPTTEVADLSGLGDLCRARGLLLVIDNSLTTAALVQPAAHGAGIVVNSLTKGFGGHGDAMGGALSDTGVFDWSRFAGIDAIYRKGDPARFGMTQIRRKGLRDCGATLRPQDAHTLAVGAETLFLRAERACATALALATWLEAQDWVETVRYPGLPRHPQHDRAATLFDGRFGQLLSFTPRPGVDASSALTRLRRVALATHLWDSRTLAIPVAHTIFSELGPEGRRLAGIDEGLIRVSVGLEPAEDLIADFDQAFGAPAPTGR